jgi:hypothetical protein
MGSVNFDSKMDTTVAANTVISSNRATITNEAWASDTRLTFDIAWPDPTTNPAVQFKVVAANAKSANNGIQLDGNGCESGPNGVGPNKDDYAWTVTSIEKYCTAGTSASGCNALISAVGTPSPTQGSGFVVTADTVEGNKTGLFFYSQNGKQANAWGNGTSYQCVVPPVKRGGVQSGGGTNGLCNGLFNQDLNARWCPTCPAPAHAPVPGLCVQVQLWYRDPLNTSSQTTSLSDALEAIVIP